MVMYSFFGGLDARLFVFRYSPRLQSSFDTDSQDLSILEKGSRMVSRYPG
jgi:hypothetical protein